MAAEWVIVQVDSLNSVGDKSDVVNVVHWECRDVSEENCLGREYGSVAVPTDDLDDFVEYGSLTEDITLGWVKDIMGDDLVEQTEDRVEAQVAEQKNPTQKTGLPWE